MDPEQLSADEVAFQQVVVQQYRSAQGALNLWLGHLRQKYRLSEHDEIDEHGGIRRQSTPTMMRPELVPNDQPPLEEVPVRPAAQD